MAYNAYSTANFGANSNGLSTGGATTPSGYAYASYLLGAVGGSTAGGGSPTLGLQPLSETGGRFKPAAPYAEDIYKLTRKLTLDIGLRWDYLPPFHEVKNRWTFLNPTLTNPLTGTPGMLQFAGNWGGAGVSYGRKTPVNTYWKNWGPRVSLAYEVTPKTVIRAGFAQVFSQAGGVGGRGGAANGTGSTGFNMTAIGPTETLSGATAGPSFYLNNSAYFAAGGYTGGASLSNTSLFGAGYAYPAAPTPNVAAQELNTGFFVCPASGIGPGGNACTVGAMVSASTVAYADPYISGRAPTIEMFNAGFQRAITANMTLAVDYMGNESHFIINSGTNGSNPRGYWVNQLDPKYLAVLGPVRESASTGPGNGKPLLNAAATPANVAILQSYFPNAVSPTVITNFENAAAKSTSATIQQMLVAFPQYSGVTDTWGTNVGNFSYHSVQFTLNQRVSKGLTFNANYTFSKNLGDDGSFRSGFPIPQAALSGGTKAWNQDRYDRSWTLVSIPHSIHAYGTYDLPFAKNGNSPWILRAVLGGWKFSAIFTYSTGAPAVVTWSGSSATTYPGQGQAQPDLDPAFTQNTARINGQYGSSVSGTNTCNLGINALGQSGCTAIPYWTSAAFKAPTNVSTASTAQYLIGNSPRTRPLLLRNPNTWNGIDANLRKTFIIHRDLAFQFEASASNVWNHVTFGGPAGSYGSATFGQITGVTSTPAPRDFQFAGHLKF
jgi:hypothetical protein